MAELRWHVEAALDLDALAQFISRDSEAYPAAFVDRIVSAVEYLRDHPEMGRLVPEFDDPSYRELIFQNYRIVYRSLAHEVVVLGVLHAAMDMTQQSHARGWDLT